LQILDGNNLQVTPLQQCTGTSIITVLDADNQPTTAALTIGATITPDMQVAPSAWTVAENTQTPDITLTVFRIAAGNSIQVFSTDRSIFAPQTPVLNANGTYSITLAGGNTCSLPISPGSPAVVTPAFVPAVPATGGDRTATITVLDAQGHQSTSTITVKDSNGVSGC